MDLNPSSTADELIAVLRDALQGQPLEGVTPRLTALGARDVIVTDLRTVDLAHGTVMGDGLAAGDPVALVLFGLQRGALRADRRVRLTLHYDDQRRVTAVTDLVLIAK